MFDRGWQVLHLRHGTKLRCNPPSKYRGSYGTPSMADILCNWTSDCTVLMEYNGNSVYS